VIQLFATFFASLAAAGWAWEKTSSKLVAFIVGAISAPIAVTLVAWGMSGFAPIEWGAQVRSNLLWGLGIGCLNGWFAGHHLSKENNND